MIIFMLSVHSGDVSVGGTAVGGGFVGAAFGAVGANDIVVGGGVGVGAGAQAATAARMNTIISL